MTALIKHIFLRLASVFLIYALLLPFAIKLDHVFDNHDHKSCTSTIESHIHKDEVQCDFLNYKINQVGYETSFIEDEVIVSYHIAKNFTLHQTFCQNQKVTSFLRGPPSLA